LNTYDNANRRTKMTDPDSGENSGNSGDTILNY
jgi:hypothetical protein